MNVIHMSTMHVGSEIGGREIIVDRQKYRELLTHFYGEMVIVSPVNEISHILVGEESCVLWCKK